MTGHITAKCGDSSRSRFDVLDEEVMLRVEAGKEAPAKFAGIPTLSTRRM